MKRKLLYLDKKKFMYLLLILIVSIVGIFISRNIIRNIQISNIIDDIDAKSVERIEIKKYFFDSKQTKVIVRDKADIEKIICILKKFDGRISNSKKIYLYEDYDNYKVRLYGEELHYSFRITERRFVDILIYNYDKDEFKKYRLKGKWKLENLDDLFGISEMNVEIY